MAKIKVMKFGGLTRQRTGIIQVHHNVKLRIYWNDNEEVVEYAPDQYSCVELPKNIENIKRIDLSYAVLAPNRQVAGTREFRNVLFIVNVYENIISIG